MPLGLSHQAPSHTRNRQPCQGQVTTSLVMSPPEREAPMCGQVSSMARYWPPRLNTATMRPLTAKASPRPGAIEPTLATVVKSLMRQGSEVRGQRSEVRGQRSEVRLLIPDSWSKRQLYNA